MRVYTEAGTYHKALHQQNEDAVQIYEDEMIEVAAVADGVSTCKYSRHGAQIAVNEAVRFIQSNYDRIGCMPESWTEILIRRIQRKLHETAAQKGTSYEDYSTTLMVAVRERATGICHYCNIGDGLILSVQSDEYYVTSRPAIRLYGCVTVTTTGIERVVTDQSVVLSNESNILLLTDGAWKSIFEEQIHQNALHWKMPELKYQRIIEDIHSSLPEDDWSIVIFHNGEAA